MKQLILLATLCVIFLWSSCQFGVKDNPVVFFPNEINQITFVDGTKDDVLDALDYDLSTFFKSHPQLLNKQSFLVGNSKFVETLMIQDFELNVFNQWIEINQPKVVEFHSWNIYQLKIENGRVIHVNYSDNYLWLSNRGYLLEEALLVKDGKVNGLIEDFPEIKDLNVNESFVAFKDFPIIEFSEIGDGMNLEPLLNAKVLGEIRKDSSRYFEGELFFDINLNIEEDTLWYQSLFLIPNDVVYAGVYQYPLPTKNIFKGKTAGAFATFLLENEVGEDSPFLIINTKGSAHDLMDDLENKYGVIEEINESLFPIKRILCNDLCNDKNDIPFLPCIHNPYIVMVGDYLVFTTSLGSMEKYLDYYVSNQNITNRKIVNFALWESKNIKGNFHYFNGIKDGGIERKESVLILDQEESNNKYKTIYNIQSTKENKSGIKKTSTYYHTNKITSELFILPSKDEEDYIIFQDELFQLHFLNKKNELIHTLGLEEAIVSKIHHYLDLETHLDRYIFNTKSKIYILDSKAQNLHNFPLKLSSPASNGLALIQIENTRSVYAFLSCENGNLYAYDLNQGLKPLPSWNPLMGMGILKEDLVFLKGNNETHFAFVNEKKLFVSLNREAENRFNSIEIEDEYKANIQIDENIKNKERFVLHNGKGKLRIINIKGEQFSLFLNQENKEGQFLLLDVLGNKQKEYVFLNTDTISIHTYKKDDFVLEYSIKNYYGITEVFEVKLQGRKSLLGGINYLKNKIYLFDNQGVLIKGFPLEGSAPFKILKLRNKQSLIYTIMNDKMLVYSINLN